MGWELEGILDLKNKYLKFKNCKINLIEGYTHLKGRISWKKLYQMKNSDKEKEEEQRTKDSREYSKMSGYLCN